ncbi:MAG: hypothetical protein IBX50_16105 [Marinospirillum sp.]|uniref:hypothetical protein n=1 Tax=Marinospirillum sp. TaxID=2183934 RepID=UPI0019DE5621|nr:hypothetical protein [Marinospirillum sp.]MBE0508212.1 hypothetical protein [Marinospirillum sp.]
MPDFNDMIWGVLLQELTELVAGVYCEAHGHEPQEDQLIRFISEQTPEQLTQSLMQSGRLPADTCQRFSPLDVQSALKLLA